MTKKQKQAADLFAKSTMNAKKKSAGDFGFPITVTKPKRARLKRIAVPSEQSAVNGMWRTSLSLQRLIQNAVPNRLMTPVDAKDIVHLNRPEWTEAKIVQLLGRCPVDIAEARLWEGLARDYFAKYSAPRQDQKTMETIIAEAVVPLKLDSADMRSLVRDRKPGWHSEAIKNFLDFPANNLDEIVIWQKHARQYVAKMKPEDFYQDVGKDEIKAVVRRMHPSWNETTIAEFMLDVENLKRVQKWSKRVDKVYKGIETLVTPEEWAAWREIVKPWSRLKTITRSNDGWADEALRAMAAKNKARSMLGGIPIGEQRICDDGEETQNQRDGKEDEIKASAAHPVDVYAAEAEARKRRKMGILDAGFLHDQTTGLLKEWENLSTALCEDNFVYGYAVATEMISIRVAFSRLFSLLAERKLITKTQGE